jgi:serine/threonine-protein kinase
MYADNVPTLYKPGDVIAGRYRIVRVLGAGGMGIVLAARHLDLDTLVAIKLLRPEVLSNRDVVARFAAEARAAVRIKSEHVARVTDVSTLPDGAPYMVMEYLEGTDLAGLVEQSGPLSVENAVDYVLQACEALIEAHCLGIVHRDLKPGNLFLSRRADGSEVVKVLDFGISKSTDGGAAGGSASLTGTGAILGSPIYMSPEQLSNSKSVDRRTDIWAIGVILHQILSGQLPFKADTLPELFMAIVQKEPPPLRSIRPDVPPGLATVVLRCLEKDRGRRFDSVSELAVALAPFAPVRSRLSVERILRMAPVALTESQAMHTATQDGDLAGFAFPPKGSETQGTWGQTASKPELRTSARVLLALGAIGLLAGAGFGVHAVMQPNALPTSAVSGVSATPSPVVSVAKPEPPSAVEVAPVPTQVPVPPVVPDEDPAPAPRAGLARPVSVTRSHAVSRPSTRSSRHGDVQPVSSAPPPEPPRATTAAPPPTTPPKPSVAPPQPKPRASDWEDERQ